MVEQIKNMEKKEKKDISKEEISKEIDKHKEFIKKKEIIGTKEETSKKLDSLKDLVDKKIISNETAKKLKTGKVIDKKEIENMFDKIDEIEEIKDVDKYLSKEYRITKQDYIKALESGVYRVQAITKLNIALTMLSEQINGDSSIGLNLFSGFLTVLDKNLIIVQENTIDVKNSLEKIGKNKKESPKLSLWQKIIKFLKELFNIK